MADEKPSQPSHDVVLPLGPTDDGGGVKVLRARGESVEAGEVRPIEEGKPIHTEVVKLSPRKDAPWLCDVEVTYAPNRTSNTDSPSDSKGHKGPARVASNAYRARWDDVFGTKKPLTN